MVAQAELILRVITLWFLVLSQYVLETVWVPLILNMKESYSYKTQLKSNTSISNIHDLGVYPTIQYLLYSKYLRTYMIMKQQF